MLFRQHLEANAHDWYTDLDSDVKQNWETELPEHEYNLFMAFRNEDRLLASETASYTHGYAKSRERRQRIPEPGDLVLIRHHTVDQQKGRKLDPKWLGPRILESWTHHGKSGVVREIQGTKKSKRYSIDDIMLYYQRPAVPSLACVQSQATDLRITTSPGQRAIHLESHRS